MKASPAENYRLVNLVDWQAHVGSAWQEKRFLRDYVPRPGLTPEQVEMMVQALRERPLTVDSDVIERELQFRSLAVNALVEELDSHS